jgi:hypothetical protein
MISLWGTMALVVLSLVAMAFSGGCEPAKTVVPIVNISPSGASSKAITLYDTNKDGKISGAELDKAPSLKAALDMLGTDANKGVTAAQIAARIQKWADDRNGLVSVLCNVAHNGVPLADAEIKFVPDPFIGEYLKQAGVGKTDSDGIATINLPREPGSDNLRGIPPGYYRVEITKAGENIPAQYNRETTFGQEISSDGELKHSLEGKKMLFDMKY